MYKRLKGTKGTFMNLIYRKLAWRTSCVCKANVCNPLIPHFWLLSWTTTVCVKLQPENCADSKAIYKLGLGVWVKRKVCSILPLSIASLIGSCTPLFVKQGRAWCSLESSVAISREQAPHVLIAAREPPPWRKWHRRSYIQLSCEYCAFCITSGCGVCASSLRNRTSSSCLIRTVDAWEHRINPAKWCLKSCGYTSKLLVPYAQDFLYTQSLTAYRILLVF